MIELIEKISYATRQRSYPGLKVLFLRGRSLRRHDYYVLNGFYCCEDCLDIRFKFTAELPDYDL